MGKNSKGKGRGGNNGGGQQNGGYQNGGHQKGGHQNGGNNPDNNQSQGGYQGRNYDPNYNNTRGGGGGAGGGRGGGSGDGRGGHQQRQQTHHNNNNSKSFYYGHPPTVGPVVGLTLDQMRHLKNDGGKAVFNCLGEVAIPVTDGDGDSFMCDCVAHGIPICFMSRLAEQKALIEYLEPLAKDGKELRQLLENKLRQTFTRTPPTCGQSSMAR